jgi:GNAT superfamily N-acetyltransferase
MVIRPVRYEDIDEIIEMGARMHAESAYDFLPFDRDKVRHLITTYAENPESRCVLVAEEKDILVGMFGGYLTNYFFCNETLACDITLFVAQEYRGSSAAVRLIRAFRDWAAARGAREICLGVSTDVNRERTGKFYERMGFARVGGIYKQRLR